MKKIDKLLSQYGINFDSISENEELIKLLSRESFNKLYVLVNKEEESSDPRFYDTKKSLSKISAQINENESKVNPPHLRELVGAQFEKIGLDITRAACKRDKELFINIIEKISSNHFQGDNNIRDISKRNYIDDLIASAQETFVSHQINLLFS